MTLPQPQTATKGLIKIIVAASVGTLIEWYDFYIFGSLSTLISAQFFPKENAAAAFLATLATFAAGLVVRPFGALFFGRLGDMIGRKYTFMVTLLLMGGSTVAIGLVPTYDTIGFLAPIIVLTLRLLQGLAIGGEFGGAITFVAEHAPVRERGFWTGLLQSTPILGYVVSLGVILLTKRAMQTPDWEAWGWRIPFLISAFMVVVSVYIRKGMSESPLFAQAKRDGKTSANPLKESFGKKANLKVVLLALFGVTIGTAAQSWGGTFYCQNFLTKTMFVDYDQANTVIMIAMLLALPACVFFGWLSDRIGLKPLIVTGLLLAVFCFRPIFEQLYQTVNLRHKVEDTTKRTVVTQRESLPTARIDFLLTTTTHHVYTDGTSCQEIKKETIRVNKVTESEVTQTIQINDQDKWTMVLLIWLTVVMVYISYGPLAAFLVELFPLKIRYTSLSLPLHIGYGIFGGMSLVIASYLTEKANATHTADYYLAGLTYPIILMSISLVIGLLYLNNTWAEQPATARPSKNKQMARKLFGIVGILLGLVTAYAGLFELGLPKILSGRQDDLIFGIIVMVIITPVATIGLLLFGKYALQGEYNQ